MLTVYRCIHDIVILVHLEIFIYLFIYLEQTADGRGPVSSHFKNAALQRISEMITAAWNEHDMQLWVQVRLMLASSPELLAKVPQQPEDGRVCPLGPVRLTPTIILSTVM